MLGFPVLEAKIDLKSVFVLAEPGRVQSRTPQAGCGVGGQATLWVTNERCGRLTLVMSVAQQLS